MKKLILLLLIVLVACGKSKDANQTEMPETQETDNSVLTDPDQSEPPNPTATLPQLQVVGNKIVNENGEVVVLRGFGINDPVLLAVGRFPDEVAWDENLFRELQDWGATIVRLPIHPPNFIDNETEALKVLDQAIEWAGEYGMYVIIDFHAFGFPPTDFLAELCYEKCAAASKVDTIQFWQTISERYEGNNIVAFYELFNEPASHPWNGLPEIKEEWIAWKEYNELVIDLIRENDPQTIVLVAGLSFAKDQSFILEAPIERSNVAYVAHHNPLTNWVFGDIAERYPVVVTEVSFTIGLEGDESYSNESNYSGTQPYRYAVTSFFDERGISWVVAAFAPSWGGFTMIEGKEFKPTETGLFWKEHISSYDREITTGEKINENEQIFSEAVGKWESIDPSDGNALSLTISSSGNDQYTVRYFDEKVPLCGLTNSGVTRWGAEAHGIGNAFYQKLDVGPLDMKCDNENEFVGGLYFDSLIYNPDSDSLTDLRGNIWTRTD